MYKNNIIQKTIHRVQSQLRSTFSTSEYSKLWDSKTVGNRSSWARPVPEKVICLLRPHLEKNNQRLLQKGAKDGQKVSMEPIISQLSKGDRGQLWEALSKEREDLSDRGFVLLQQPKDISSGDLKGLFWYLCQLFGRVLIPSTELNTGLSASLYSKPFQSGFKTYHFGDSIQDYVAFLCQNPERVDLASPILSSIPPGQEEFQLISGYSAFSQLSRRSRATLGQKTFRFKEKSQEVLLPIFQVRDDGGLSIRYSGPGSIDPRLNYEQCLAIEELEDVLARRQLRVPFQLQKGDMFFINNQWILNNAHLHNSVAIKHLDIASSL
jgi:hypothetical protein